MIFFLNISDLFFEWESVLYYIFYMFCYECGFIGYYFLVNMLSISSVIEVIFMVC